MAVKLGDAVLYLSADDTKLKRTMDEAERTTSRFGDVVTGAFMGVGMAAVNAFGSALSGVIGVVGDSIGAASDLSETISKTGVIFGDSTEALVKWAEGAATAFGQSEQQALDAAATFAMFGKTAGLSGQDLNDFSTTFTELASDLASFNNTDPQQAIEALGAALRGESEPMRAYQVLLDDATLKAKALEMGLYDGTGALDNQAKVMATYASIMEQTTVQQGDFARTSEGLANTQRQLDSTFENLKARLGTAFLPVAQKVAGWALDFATNALPAIETFITGTLSPAIDGLLALIDRLGDAFSRWKANYGDAWVRDMKGIFSDLNMPARLQEITDAFQSFADWFKGGDAQNPIGWMSTVGGVIAALSDAFMHQAERMVYGVKLLAGAFDLLMKGQFAEALAAANLGGTLLSNLGPQAFVNDFLSTFRETQAQLQASANAQHATPNYPTTPPSWGGPQYPGTTTINQTINGVGGDPNAVGAAARDGLLSAMYANGM